MSASRLQREIARCRREIREIERLLRSGHPDVEGLVQALADWSAEKRLLEDKESRRAANPAAEVGGNGQAGIR